FAIWWFFFQRSFRDSHFSAVFALETALFQANESSVASTLQIRDFRSFLEVVFVHLSLAGRTFRRLVVQVTMKFFVRSHIVFISDNNIFVFYYETICDKI